MQCIYCGAKSAVEKTRPTADGIEVVRYRRCQEERTHSWQTTETINGHRLDDLYVLRTGDQRPLHQWSEDKLRSDLVESALDQLTPTEVEAIVGEVVVGLTRKVRQPGDQSMVLKTQLRQVRHRPKDVYAIKDTDIRDEVEQCLRKREHDMIRVLYSLAVRGRVLRSRQNEVLDNSGWHRAEDVLEWLYLDDNYPHLQPARFPRREAVYEEIWTPEANGMDPVFVRKKPRSGRSTPLAFVKDQFVASIEKAVLGRPNAAALAQYVSWFVLRQLTGQRTVSSSQLGVGVLDCLRRVDDIAYLRWATVMKEIDSVEEFHDEAIALVLHPSPRLAFADRIARPIETTRRPPER
ncbi:hypothetical protein Y013_24740 (plasmid) [Rhodococcus pyridinivorans SB3094]|uniref:ATP-cone domain-containing protein n=1 Tax=Rhodococcus pyridinivorans SB3094 TaxID=1435356 RepID=V9XPB7_9NOCA|nr:hypothetical protein [Rhodococcus sp. PAE-6]AHD24233.1 hypothetical protein Y013_24740 [Rhodococcus pyridinivorans SB3094]MCT7293875.1 hypothetical protein [Rhodococcus sp. PAE-6]